MRLFELETDDNAVSPVIGVILMVAITVILAAVIGTFVLGMGENVQQNAQAGVSFSSAGNNVDVQLTTLGNVDDPSHISLKQDGCTGFAGGTSEFSSIGETLTVEGCDAGDKITVIAELNGRENVIATHTKKGS